MAAAVAPLGDVLGKQSDGADSELISDDDVAPTRLARRRARLPQELKAPTKRTLTASSSAPPDRQGEPETIGSAKSRIARLIGGTTGGDHLGICGE